MPEHNTRATCPKGAFRAHSRWIEREFYPADPNYSLIEPHLTMGGDLGDAPPGASAMRNLWRQHGTQVALFCAVSPAVSLVRGRSWRARDNAGNAAGARERKSRGAHGGWNN